MEHYFINKSHKTSDFFSFNADICGIKFTFNSCEGIFSKSHIDLGSLLLIKTVSKMDSYGEGLDLCCGYGVIGIALAKLKNLKIDMCDINETAVQLAKENKIINNVTNGIVKVSDGLLSFNKLYDFIVSNPPIKVGKSVTFRLLNEAYKSLTDGGKLIIVIRKDKGMESVKKYLQSLGADVTIIATDKGYYILETIKII